MIHPVWGTQSGSFLTLRGFDVRYKTYANVGHEIGLEEVRIEMLNNATYCLIIEACT